MEKEAAEAGKPVVGLEEVKATQKRYLSGMAAEIKGYQLDTCFGPGGCTNRTVESDLLVEALEQILLQLVQVLKYEANHYSALAQFLLDRACLNEVRIGTRFFWYLKV